MSNAQRRHRDDDFPPRRGLQKRWFAFLAVVLMLAALAGYVLSNDESLVPGEPLAQPVPAAP